MVIVRTWTPDQQRITSCCAASGERKRRLRAGGGVTAAQTPRVPDAVQRSSRCTAEPGPTLSLCGRGPRISSAPRRYCGALRSIRGTSKHSEGVSRIQFVGQITPIRVALLDQSDLPGAAPALPRMFSRASIKDGIAGFKIDESIDFVFACETSNKLG